MDIVLLSDGLGNQMFQYAFYLARKKHQRIGFNTYLIRRCKIHNGYELDNVFNIKDKQSLFEDMLVRFMRKLTVFENRCYFKSFVFMMIAFLKILKINIIIERKGYTFDEKYLFDSKGINIYWGWWFTENYFKNKKSLIQSVFRFDTTRLNECSQNILEKIINGQSVSLHIRRGDYLYGGNEYIHGNICTISYYNRAIQLIIDKVENPEFYIFSDDMEWVKTNLHICGAEYIDWNKSVNSWQDMCLMSKCRHHIIANSSFSWWAAWLGDYERKITIAPDHFLIKGATPDAVPEGWIVLTTK